MKRVVQKPQRSILRGGNLDRAASLHTQGEFCYKGHTSHGPDDYLMRAANFKLPLADKESAATTPDSALFARDGESALRDKLPGERAHAIR